MTLSLVKVLLPGNKSHEEKKEPFKDEAVKGEEDTSHFPPR